MYVTARSDFAWGHFGKSLLWGGAEALGLYLLVSVHGIAPALAGMALFASMVWNAVLDGLIGIAIARHWIPQAALGRLNLAAIALAGLSFAALPLALPGGAAAPIALLFITRSAFSLIDVQHNLASAPLADAVGHLTMARLRALLATLAAATIAFAAAPLIHDADRHSLVPGLLVSAVGLISALCMIPVPRLLRQTAAMAPGGEAPALVPQSALLGYAAIVALGFAGIGAVPKALLQIDFSHDWQSAAVLPVLTIARLCANPVSTVLAAHGGILAALRKALVASGVLAMALPLLGWHIVLDAVLVAGFGIAAGAVALLGWRG